MSKIITFIATILVFNTLCFSQRTVIEPVQTSQTDEVTTPIKSKGEYKEGVSFGAFIEKTSIKESSIKYKLVGEEYDVDMDYWLLYGIGAHLPFKNCSCFIH